MRDPSSDVAPALAPAPAILTEAASGAGVTVSGAGGAVFALTTRAIAGAGNLGPNRKKAMTPPLSPTCRRGPANHAGESSVREA